MDSLRDFLHPPKCLKPMKEMLPQELIHLVMKMSATLLQMRNPVETRVLKLWWKTLLDLTSLDIRH
jgi:hypothetical protein